jgi:hypothetical protein
MGPTVYTRFFHVPLITRLSAVTDCPTTPLVCCRYRAYLHQILAAMKAPYLQIQELTNNVVRVCLACVLSLISLSLVLPDTQYVPCRRKPFNAFVE